MADETESISALNMDRGLTLGNSDDTFGRRSLHVKIGNKVTEPLPVNATFVSPVSSTATLSNVAASTSSVSILASNSNRKGFILFNESSSNVRVAFASTASSSSFSIFLNANMTYQNEAIIYTGVISAIWESATGNMRVTELLA